MRTRRLLTVAAATAAALAVAAPAVAAWTSSGTGVASGTSAALGAPGAPTAGTATTTSIPLSWTASSALGPLATSYTVERRLDSGPTWTAACGGAATTSTGCTDTGLVPGTAYRYRVTAAYADWRTTGAGSAALSTASAPSVLAPAAPATVTLGNTCSGFQKNVTTTVTVNWSAVTGATGYKVYRSSSSTPAATDPVVVVGDVTTAGITYSWSGNQSTYFWVAASNVAGDSPRKAADRRIALDTNGQGSCTPTA